MAETFYIKTFGCKVNQYESQLIREGLINSGWKEASFPEQAEICIVNGCAVTIRAEGKSIDECRAFLRGRKKSAKVVLTGCAASSVIEKGKDIFEEDMVIVLQTAKPDIFSKIGIDAISPNTISNLSGHTRAFVKLQDGCNMGCSYCYIPFLRGSAKLRPDEEIKDEIMQLSKSGYNELVFTGICLGWGGQDIAGFAGFAVKDAGVNRVRLSSIEPFFVSDDIVLAIKHGYICPHLHIPFQSGSDSVLRRMNRDYNSDFYTSLVYRLRKAVPEIAISTDIMVGFPGETEQEFEETLRFLETVRPMRIHVFPYSRRPKTAAAKMPGQIPYKVKKERVREVLDLAKRLSQEYARRFIGKELEVLFENSSGNHWYGFAENYIQVSVSYSGDLRGRLCSVKIKGIDEEGKAYGEISEV